MFKEEVFHKSIQIKPKFVLYCRFTPLTRPFSSLPLNFSRLARNAKMSDLKAKRRFALQNVQLHSNLSVIIADSRTLLKIRYFPFQWINMKHLLPRTSYSLFNGCFMGITATHRMLYSIKVQSRGDYWIHCAHRP